MGPQKAEESGAAVTETEPLVTGKKKGRSKAQRDPDADEDCDHCVSESEDEGICQECDDGKEEWWTIQKLSEELKRLPVSELYPDLVVELLAILKLWEQRFPRHVWRRMLKIGKGSAFHVPRILKEFNESAPVILQIRRWLVENGGIAGVNSSKATIIDCGAGFGFLSMFLSEMLPKDRVSRIFLLDKDFPNLHAGLPGKISVDHISGASSIGWKIPLATLKCNLKKGKALWEIQQRLCGPDNGPCFIAGIHVCNTLSLRVTQLFNESPNAMGLIVAPCCLPTKRHAQQEVAYRLGQHRFFAVDLQTPPSADQKFKLWVDNIFKGIGSAQDAEDAVSKRLDIIDIHKVSSAYYAQNAFLFASRPSWPVAPSKFVTISTSNAFLPVVEEAAYTKKKGDRLPRKKWASAEERIAAREEKKRQAHNIPALNMHLVKESPEESSKQHFEAVQQRPYDAPPPKKTTKQMKEYDFEAHRKKHESHDDKDGDKPKNSFMCWIMNGPCMSR